MKWVRSALATGIVALAVSAASAQTGGITVVVTDDTGVTLPGATVTISHPTGYVATTTVMTDKNGLAEFPVLRAGADYSIEVAFPGLNTIREDGLKVSIGQSQTIPVQLMSEVTETVKVVAKREVIDQDENAQTTKFSDNFINDLPVPGRFYTNVLTMAPGVQDADGDGNPNVHGSRSRDFNTLVGGVSNVDPLTGQQQSRINPNSIEEMEVITAGAGVEFGRAQGGFARIIQKQGSNTHEGVTEFYYRTSKLDGEDPKNSGIGTTEYTWYQPSLQMSGPIVRDKLWYRASIELRDIDIPVITPTGNDVATIEDQTNDFQVTWQVSPRNKLAVNYRQDPRTITNFGLGAGRDARSSLGRDTETQTTSLTWTAPYSPKVLVESVASWTDQVFSQYPNTIGELNNCIGPGSFLGEAQCFNGNTGRITGSYFETQNDHRQRLTVRGNATVYGGRFWGMSHQFKLGVSMEGERYFRDLSTNPSVAYFIVNTQDEETGGSGTGNEFKPLGIALATLSVPPNDDVRATSQNWGLYGEDQFKPRQNLTVTAGVRVDREEIGSEGRELFDPRAELDFLFTSIAPYMDPSSPLYGPGSTIVTDLKSQAFTGYEDYETFKQILVGQLCEPGPGFATCYNQTSLQLYGQQQVTPNRVRRTEDITIGNTNFSPYLAVSWDPFSNGKMLFAASAGRHYNNIPLQVPLQEMEPAQTDLVYEVEFDGANANIPQLSSGISPTVNVTMVDPDLRTPYQDEFTFSFERELWAETSMKFTYINRKYRDQLQDRNINAGIGDYGRCLLATVDNPRGYMEESWGEGHSLVDPYSNQTYLDTDPGPGDGIMDDCVGDTENIDYQGDNYSLQRPDEFTDLYKLNPLWGDIYLIGNFNEADYDGLVFELIRRQYRSWELQGSYTYSRAEGNGEDYNQGFDDDPSVEAEDLFGAQSYDQRHVVKLNATTITPWGIRLGTATSWQSGLPYSVLWRRVAWDTLPPWTANDGTVGVRGRFFYPTGERNDQRNESYWNVDVRASKELTLARGMNLQLSAEIFNLLDDEVYTVYNTDFERGQQVNGFNEAYYRNGRSWQLGMKLAF